MSDKVQIPFQFHLRSVQCVPSEEAARIASSNGVRGGLNDAQVPVEQLDLHGTPEFDRMISDARRVYAAERSAEADRAQLGHALANAAFQPRNIPPGASRPDRALYQNILPPRPGASASAGDARPRI